MDSTYSITAWKPTGSPGNVTVLRGRKTVKEYVTAKSACMEDDTSMRHPRCQAELKLKILKFVTDNPGFDAEEIADAMDIDLGLAVDLTSEMVEEGLLRV